MTSSLRECPIDFTTLVMGEVGLGGEVRGDQPGRVEGSREAAKDGVQRLSSCRNGNVAKLDPVEGIELIGIREVGDALDAVLVWGVRSKKENVKQMRHLMYVVMLVVLSLRLYAVRSERHSRASRGDGGTAHRAPAGAGR